MEYHNYTTDELLDLASNETGTLAAELADRVVSNEEAEKLQDEIESLKEEIESLKEEIRDRELSEIRKQCKEHEELMREYHQGKDYLSNYFYREHIADSLTYSDRLKAQILEIDPDINDDEYEYIKEQIIHGMIGTEIKTSHMNTCENRELLCVCSSIIGEIEEQLPEELTKQFEVLKMTDDEIEGCFDNYYRGGSVYFDYSYDVVGLYVTADSVFECIADYRSDK